MSNRLLASCVAIAMLGAGPVSATHAAEEGFYFGITGGQSIADLDKSELDDTFSEIAADVAFANGLDLTDFISEFDESDAAWALRIGYQWNSYVGAEVGYVNLGEAVYDSVAVLNLPDDPDPLGFIGLPSTYENSGITAALVGTLPLGEKFDLSARGGMLFARNRISLRGTDASTGEVISAANIRSNSRDFFVGLGGAWNINSSYSVSFQYQRFLDVGDDEESLEFDIDLISLSVEFR